jgi:hypothetical protein
MRHGSCFCIHGEVFPVPRKIFIRPGNNLALPVRQERVYHLQEKVNSLQERVSHLRESKKTCGEAKNRNKTWKKRLFQNIPGKKYNFYYVFWAKRKKIGRMNINTIQKIKYWKRFIRNAVLTLS